MTERHEHKHEHDAIGVEVQLPTAPIEIQVKRTYRIDDDTKAWLDGVLKYLGWWLIFLGVAAVSVAGILT